MSQNVVSIRRFHEKATRATNDFGERFADAPQHPDIKAVKALLTAWAEETRQAGIVRLLTNVRMWIVIGVLLLVIAVLPLGPKLRSLRPILMIAVTLGLPIALFIKHCIDVEKYLMKALGPNDFQVRKPCRFFKCFFECHVIVVSYLPTSPTTLPTLLIIHTSMLSFCINLSISTCRIPCLTTFPEAFSLPRSRKFQQPKAKAAIAAIPSSCPLSPILK